MAKIKTKDDYLAESANRFMGWNMFEQYEIDNATDEEEVVDEAIEDIVDIEPTDTETDIELDGEELEGEEGEEEVEMISVEDAIKAFQMVQDGTCETIEEAIDMVKAEAGEETEEEITADIEGDDVEEVEEGACTTTEETDEFPEELGESLFMKYTARYL